MHRTPGLGVSHVVRFNWPMYVGSAVALAALLVALPWLTGWLGWAAWVAIAGLVAQVGMSLLGTWWVYDHSEIYDLSWLGDGNPTTITSLNAGFDEISERLQQHYPNAELTVLDLYNPAVNTEASIERARQLYPPYPGTQTVTYNSLPVPNGSQDLVVLFFVAHELRRDEEKVALFREVRRTLSPGGTIYMVEHGRDWVNFLFYSIGFLHFASPATWRKTIAAAQLSILEERKVTPLVTVYKLCYT